MKRHLLHITFNFKNKIKRFLNELNIINNILYYLDKIELIMNKSLLGIVRDKEETIRYK